MDIKNTIEVVDCIDTLANCVRDAEKDGEINWRDVPKFAPMIAATRKAVADAQAIKAELADLDEAETQQLVGRAFDALTNLADAILGAPAAG